MRLDLFTVASLLSLSLLSLICSPASALQEKVASKDGATEPRVLNFPPDRSIGTLSIAPKPVGKCKFTFWYGFDGFKEIGLARGEVKIPADSVVRLELSVSACENLEPLGSLPPDAIDLIYCGSGRIKGFEHLGKLTGLKSLCFRGCAIKDEDMAQLAGLKNLEFFDCSVYDYEGKGFGLTNKSAKVIGKFKKLRYLSLRANPMSDEGFADLEGCDQLEVLSLDGTKVTGKGLTSLYMFPKLEYLSFGAYQKGAWIDDAGLDVLSDMKQLKDLSQWNQCYRRRDEACCQVN